MLKTLTLSVLLLFLFASVAVAQEFPSISQFAVNLEISKIGFVDNMVSSLDKRH